MVVLFKTENRIMASEFKAGDKVQWESSQGVVHGTVKKKLTSPTDIKGHHVAASKEHPEYLVVSDKTGAEAAHKGSALKKA
jgi:Hypervirulence associated proteins TUDOR domain